MDIRHEIPMPILALALLPFIILSVYYTKLWKATPSLASDEVTASSSKQSPLSEQKITDSSRTPDRRNSNYEVSKDPDTPDGWFTDEKIFSLERRAIFSKTWLCITHISHFHKAGDYLSFNIADFPFFLILGKDSKLRGFHNVCRHRAYTVARKTTGSSLVLGCRYHGWSYDTKGKLIKAPDFEDVPGFKKEENSLFEIYVRTDPHGFVSVNLNADTSIPEPQAEMLGNFAHQAKITPLSSMVAFWQMEGDFNWKLADPLLNANQDRAETSLIPSSPPPSLLAWLFGKNVGNRHSVDVPYQLSLISAVRSFNNNSYWSMTVVEPISATRCSIRCTLYTTKTTTKQVVNNTLVECIHAGFESEAEALEQKYSLITETGAGEPVMTRTQQDILKQLEEHMKLERKAGTEILPAAQHELGKSGSYGVAERLCRELDSLADTNSGCFNPGSPAQGLAW